MRDAVVLLVAHVRRIAQPVTIDRSRVRIGKQREAERTFVIRLDLPREVTAIFGTVRADGVNARVLEGARKIAKSD